VGCLIDSPARAALHARMDLKLFFAVLPPPDIGHQIERLGAHIRRARGLRGRMIEAARLHNTLAPVHAVNLSLPQTIARAKVAAATLHAPSFPVRFEWTQSFTHRDRKPFVLGGRLAPLRAFQGELREAMIRAGLPVPSVFTPHITLLWADHCVQDAAPIAPLEWIVRDFTLVASLPGQSRHIHLARWTLHETRAS